MDTNDLSCSTIGKLTIKESVDVMMRARSTLKEEIRLQSEFISRQTNYLLGLLMVASALGGALMKEDPPSAFLKWIETFAWWHVGLMILLIHLIALFLAANVTSALHTVIMLGRDARRYENSISKYMTCEEDAFYWENYLIRKFVFNPFPFRVPLIPNPYVVQFFAAAFAVIVVNIFSMQAADQLMQGSGAFRVGLLFAPAFLWVILGICHVLVYLGCYRDSSTNSVKFRPKAPPYTTRRCPPSDSPTANKPVRSRSLFGRKKHSLYPERRA